jgi:hypothetical protein
MHPRCQTMNPRNPANLVDLPCCVTRPPQHPRHNEVFPPRSESQRECREEIYVTQRLQRSFTSLAARTIAPPGERSQARRRRALVFGPSTSYTPARR